MVIVKADHLLHKDYVDIKTTGDEGKFNDMLPKISSLVGGSDKSKKYAMKVREKIYDAYMSTISGGEKCHRVVVKYDIVQNFGEFCGLASTNYFHLWIVKGLIENKFRGIDASRMFVNFGRTFNGSKATTIFLHPEGASSFRIDIFHVSWQVESYNEDGYRVEMEFYKNMENKVEREYESV